MTTLQETDLNTSEFDVDPGDSVCHTLDDEGKALCGAYGGKALEPGQRHTHADCERLGHKDCIDCDWIWTENYRNRLDWWKPRD